MRFVKKVAAVSTIALVTCIANATPNTAPATPNQALASNATTFTQEQNSAIDEQVQKYLSNNPKVVVDALVNYREQEAKRMETNAQNAVTKNAKEILGNNNAPTMGNPNGNVILVEFLDYQCGYCKKMSTTVQSASPYRQA